jgi:acetate kinase
VGAILVVNAGSTSLKLSLVGEDESTERVGSLSDAAGAGIDAVAHRVVHGGARFTEPALIDGSVREAIHELEALAPLHNAPALRGIEEATAARPDVPHVAVFDTAFHATIPPEASTYALPRAWREEWGVRRFGFHGLSVQWAAEQVRVRRLVVCHLGGGCSVTAVRDGRSVDTTMGFTPLEGVPMSSRSGSVDPGAFLFLLRERGLDSGSIDQALNFDSGLVGLAGSGDMAELESRVEDGDREAALAVDVFAYRVAGAVAAMAVAAGGIDALVFTAGIGERSSLTRARVCERLGFLGIALDAALNAAAEPDSDVGSAGSSVRIVVLEAHEELVAARAARALLATAGQRPAGNPQPRTGR